MLPEILRLRKPQILPSHSGQDGPALPLQADQSSVFQHLPHQRPLLLNALLHLLEHMQKSFEESDSFVRPGASACLPTWVVSCFPPSSTFSIALCSKLSASRRSRTKETCLCLVKRLKTHLEEAGKPVSGTEKQVWFWDVGFDLFPSTDRLTDSWPP